MDQISKLAAEVSVRTALKMMEKGDVSGHEFHGNQYSGGGGGEKDSKGSSSKKDEAAKQRAEGDRLHGKADEAFKAAKEKDHEANAEHKKVYEYERPQEERDAALKNGIAKDKEAEALREQGRGLREEGNKAYSSANKTEGGSRSLKDAQSLAAYHTEMASQFRASADRASRSDEGAVRPWAEMNAKYHDEAAEALRSEGLSDKAKEASWAATANASITSSGRAIAERVGLKMGRPSTAALNPGIKFRMGSGGLRASGKVYEATKDAITKVLKGDVSGHEFHGNQYSGGGGGSSKEEQNRSRHLEEFKNSSVHENKGGPLKTMDSPYDPKFNGIYVSGIHDSKKDRDKTVEQSRKTLEGMGFKHESTEERTHRGGLKDVAHNYVHPDGTKASLSYESRSRGSVSVVFPSEH